MAAEDVITLDDALDQLNMSDPSESDEAELGVHISAASEAVEFYTGPVLIREFTDYEVGGRYSMVLDRRPVVELVSITLSDDGTALDVDGYRVVPTAGLVRPVGASSATWPHPSFRKLRGGPFDVTYRAGRVETITEVPDALNLACRIIVANLWEPQRGATLGPQPGAFSDGDDFVDRRRAGLGYAIPYRALTLMAPYRTVALG